MDNKRRIEELEYQIEDLEQEISDLEVEIEDLLAQDIENEDEDD